MYSAFGWHLKDNLKRKYGLSEARNRNEPCLFFGVYGSQIEKAVKWADKAKVLIWYSGSDVSYCFRGREHLIEIHGSRRQKQRLQCERYSMNGPPLTSG